MKKPLTAELIVTVSTGSACVWEGLLGPLSHDGTAHSKGPFLPESWHGWGQAQLWPQF